MDKTALKKIIYCFAVCILCFLLCVVIDYVWEINYVINDDVAMREIASGIRSGQPDGHLIYIKYPLGWLFSQLYKNIGMNFDWYGIFMIGIIALCWGLALFRIFESIKPTGIKIGLMALVTCLLLRHIFQLQWTMCAAIPGVTAVFFYMTISSKNRYIRIAEKIMSISLLIVCYMIRDKVFWLVAACAFFCVIYKEVKEEGLARKSIYMLAMAFGGILLGIGVTECIDKLAYSSEEWQQYYDFNHERSLIYDFYGIPDYDEHIEFYEKEGISRNTYVNLKSYGFIYDPNIDTSTLSKIAEYSKAHSQEDSFKQNVCRFWQSFIKDQDFTILRWAMVILFVGVIGSSIKAKDRLMIRLCLGEVCVWGILVVYLIYQGRFPSRIIYTVCLIFVYIFLTLAIYNLQRKENTYKFGKLWIICSFLILGLNVCFFNDLIGESVNRQQANLSIYQIREYANEHPDSLYLLPSSAFAKYTDHLDFLRDDFNGKILPTGGWAYKSPVTSERLASMEINDIPKDLVEKDCVFFLNWDGQSIEYILNSIEENLNCRVIYKITDKIDTIDGIVNVYCLQYDETNILKD